MRISPSACSSLRLHSSEKKLKSWQGWLLFGGSMAIVFVLGLVVSSLMERRAEVAGVFNNKRTEFTDSIVVQSGKFKADYPREYETWAQTEDTSFESKYNSSDEVDVLAARPEMVVLWAGYAFSRDYNTPRGHTGEIPVPDYSTKEKAQQAIGLDMPTLRQKKQRFLDEIVPKWIDEAKENGKLIVI